MSVTSTTVFGSDTTKEVLAMHLGQRPTDPLPDATNEVDVELQKLVLECLAKTPDLRPSDALVVERRLEEWARIVPWSQDEAAHWWEKDSGGSV